MTKEAFAKIKTGLDELMSALDIMKVATVSSEEEFDLAVEAAKKNGLRVAAVSNAGLSATPGKVRITFLPDSCFRPTPSPQESAIRAAEER